MPGEIQHGICAFLSTEAFVLFCAEAADVTYRIGEVGGRKALQEVLGLGPKGVFAKNKQTNKNQLKH